MSKKPILAGREITVWLVEDNHTFRNTLVRGISKAGNIVCCQDFSNAEDALEAFKREPAPDVLLIDVELPGINGIEAIKAIKQLSETTHVIILTVFDGDNKVVRAIHAGASGYLLKTSTIMEIKNSIEEVVAGGAPMTPKVARSVLKIFASLAEPKQDYGLTAREQAILELMTTGLIKKEIAEKLGLSYHTVDTHMRNIYSKMHVHTSAAAVAKALNRNSP